MSIWQLVALLAGAPSTAVVVRWLAGHLTGRAKTRADEIDHLRAELAEAKRERVAAIAQRDADRDEDDDERDRLRERCEACTLELQRAIGAAERALEARDASRAEAELVRGELAMAKRFLATLMTGQ